MILLTEIVVVRGANSECLLIMRLPEIRMRGESNEADVLLKAAREYLVFDRGYCRDKLIILRLLCKRLPTW
jgi:hypothetical protein